MNRILLEKCHDLSDYLGHIKAVSATIDIKIEASHFYFSVDRSYEATADHYYQQSRKFQRRSPSDKRRSNFRRTRYMEKKILPKTSHPKKSSSDFHEENILNCSFISDAPLPEDQTPEEIYQENLINANCETVIENMEIDKPSVIVTNEGAKDNSSDVNKSKKCYSNCNQCNNLLF